MTDGHTDASEQSAVGPMPAHLMHRDNPERSGADYMAIVSRAIKHHPRSLQAEIGPSEIGDPCARKIGYKLLRTRGQERPPAWKPTIGTAVHSWLEDAFDADNLASMADRDGEERWLVETRVTAGYVPGVGFVTGSCDLYDRVCAQLWDHKVVGRAQLKKYRAQGPSQVYRVQAHLYGQGWANRGFPVDRVGISFLPRDGDLSDAYQWSEPFDPQIAADALSRLESIAAVTGQLQRQAPAALDTADSYCTFCPFFRRGSTELTSSCPGHEGATTSHTDRQLAGLVTT